MQRRNITKKNKDNTIMFLNQWLQRFSKYASIGLVLTLINFLLIDLLLFILKSILPSLQSVYSISFFISSVLVTFLSFYFNRKITFKDKKRKHVSKWISLLTFYLLYGFSALLVSILSYHILIVSPNISIQLLKIFGLVLAVILNYFGQQILVYKK
jgi:putative flippase GtrA